MLPLFLMLKQCTWSTHTGASFCPAWPRFRIFLVRQFMLSIPQELLKPADRRRERIQDLLDDHPSAGPSDPGHLAIFVFMSSWNDFMWPLIVLTDDSRYTCRRGGDLVGEHVQTWS